jgi:hypothetical protein
VAGTFLHLHLAIGSFPAAFGLRPEERPAELPSFLAGTLAPDVGFFPGGPRTFSHRVHHEATGDFVRALLSAARSSVDEAFAAGWALHVEIDVATHPLVNLQASYKLHELSADRPDLWHKRIEWGLDCEILGATVYQPPLWEQPLQFSAEMLVSAARSVYGIEVNPHRLRRRLSALAGWIQRLAMILFWSGSASRDLVLVPWRGPGRLPNVARTLARRFENLSCVEDLVAILSPEVPEEGFTLTALAASDIAVAAFHRGWAERFVNVANRDLDTGQVVA